VSAGSGVLRRGAAPAAGAAVCCLSCRMRPFCLPAGLSDADCLLVERLVARRFALARGEHLYRMDEPATGRLYAIRLGQFKTYQLSEDGAQAVAGFLAAGDVLGVDVVGAPRQRCSALALCDSSLCEFSYLRLAGASLRDASAPALLERLLSKYVAREQWTAMLVRDGRASQKLAGLLLAMAARQRGAAPQLQLLMTRQDIGDYLGMTAETVSRLLCLFERDGCIRVARRFVRVLDAAALAAFVGGAAAKAPPP
jgi:CRP/FNR family transcriptional regulator